MTKQQLNRIAHPEEFYATAKQILDTAQFDVFRFHHLLGADRRACCQRLGITPEMFDRLKQAIEQRLETVFATGHAPLVYALTHEKHTTTRYAEKRLKRTAHHEAGHGVTVTIVELPFEYVTIEANDTYAGHIALVPEDPPEDVDPFNPDWNIRRARSYWARHICGLLAGALAESLYTKEWQTQDVRIEATDECKAWQIADYFDPPARADRWVNRLRFQTLELLRVPEVWDAVTLVAEQLMKHKTLDAKAVRALVREMLPCVDEVRNAGPGTLFSGIYQYAGCGHRGRKRSR